MVEQNAYLDNLFTALSDPIRRDILARLINAQLSISEIACNYNISFAAVAKHVKVLELSKLIDKTRQGNEQIVSIQPVALKDAACYLKNYQKLWNDRFDAVDNILKEKS